MSVLTVTPTADTIVELDEERHYYVVTVDWEWNVCQYIMVSDKSDAIAIDFTPTIVAMPRDEGFVITDVRPL